MSRQIVAPLEARAAQFARETPRLIVGVSGEDVSLQMAGSGEDSLAMRAFVTVSHLGSKLFPVEMRYYFGVRRLLFVDEARTGRGVIVINLFILVIKANGRTLNELRSQWIRFLDHFRRFHLFRREQNVLFSVAEDLSAQPREGVFAASVELERAAEVSLASMADLLRKAIQISALEAGDG